MINVSLWQNNYACSPQLISNVLTYSFKNHSLLIYARHHARSSAHKEHANIKAWLSFAAGTSFLELAFISMIADSKQLEHYQIEEMSWNYQHTYKNLFQIFYTHSKIEKQGHIYTGHNTMASIYWNVNWWVTNVYTCHLKLCYVW